MIPGSKNLEFFRKAWHSLNGMLIAWLYQRDILKKSELITGLKVLFILSICFEVLRFRDKKFNKNLLKIVSPIMRKSEAKQISGIPFYLLGCLFAIYFFSKEVAVLSILFLAIGDSAASFFGRRWGHLSFKCFNGKTLIGFCGGTFVCSLITLIYLMALSSRATASIILISVLAGLIGGLSELFSVIDDNLFIPVVSALGLHFLLIWI